MNSLNKVLIWIFIALAGFNTELFGRDLRPFIIRDYLEIGLNVHIPAYPLWGAEVYDGLTVPILQIRSPELYYPETLIQISNFKTYKVSYDGLPDVAINAMNTIRAQSNVLDIESGDYLTQFQQGGLRGYTDYYTASGDGKEVDIKTIVAVFPSGKLVTVLVVTPVGQLAHIEDMVDKVMANLKEIE